MVHGQQSVERFSRPIFLFLFCCCGNVITEREKEKIKSNVSFFFRPWGEEKGFCCAKMKPCPELFLCTWIYFLGISQDSGYHIFPVSQIAVKTNVFLRDILNFRLSHFCFHLLERPNFLQFELMPQLDLRNYFDGAMLFFLGHSDSFLSAAVSAAVE